MGEAAVRNAEAPAGPVLIVEDKEDVREALALIVGGAGYDVRTAEDGLAALDMLRRERASLIVLDLMLPVMDGVEFRTYQRRDRALGNIPVIILSAFRPREGADELGASAFLEKPIDAHRLVAAIDRHCARA
jgi:CheY-like chemotaxis protein